MTNNFTRFYDSIMEYHNDLGFSFTKSISSVYSDETGITNSSLESILTWLCRDDILTNDERQYLKNIIGPFRERVNGIYKTYYYDNNDNVNENYYSINIGVTTHDPNVDDLIALPEFSIDSNYFSGLELDIEYSLEDLDL